MAKTFYRKRIGNAAGGFEVSLTSFYGGVTRGRCLQIGIGNQNKTLTSDFVRMMRDKITGELKTWRIGQRLELSAGENSVRMKRAEALDFLKEINRWLNGEHLTEIR